MGKFIVKKTNQIELPIMCHLAQTPVAQGLQEGEDKGIAIIRILPVRLR